VLRYVADHHERWDGKGYPKGLAGQEISIGGRILAAADAYEAVTSSRTYREAMTQEKALTHLSTLAGSLLDPTCFQALRAVVERGRTLTFIE
jgi:putative two-component system response regulator